jgi:hypothetical protein
MPLEPLEEAVLQKLLDGNHPVLAALRRQLAGLEVKERRLTGVGFFTVFSTTEGVPPAAVPPGGSPFGDVEATISGMEHGAGFLLWLSNGRIEKLEGYSYDEPWPYPVGEFSLRYLESNRRSVLAQLG